MATAELDNETDLADFDESPQENSEANSDVSTEAIESQDPQVAPAIDQPVDDTGEYDIDLGDETEQTTEQSGESDPPVEAAEPATEPAVSGVEDGESFPPELLRLTNLDAARAKAAFGTPERLEQAWLQQVMQAGREADVRHQQKTLPVGQAQEPPKTADGDWHFVQENFAHVTGNEVVNWTVEKSLNSNTDFTEKMIIPNNRTFTLNFLEGGSFTVPTYIKLEWYEDIGGSVFMRRNPEIRVEEVRLTTVNGAHSVSDTVITLNNANNELEKDKINK